MALCNQIYVKEYKDLMSQLFCWLIFVKCTIMIRNYNAYLILALFGHDGHFITIANVSLQFKRYYFNINTKFNHSQRSHIFQCSISTKPIQINIIIIQIIAISLNIILIFCLLHFWVRLDNMDGFQPYYNFVWDGRMLNLAYNMFAIFQNLRKIYAFEPTSGQLCNSWFSRRLLTYYCLIEFPDLIDWTNPIWDKGLLDT